MNRKALFFICAAALPIVFSCGEKKSEDKTAGTKAQAVEPADSFEAEDLGLEYVYAEEALWRVDRGEALERPDDLSLASFDSFFVITNSNNPEPQYPVAEAGPPREDYDGTWRTFTVTWTDEGLIAHKTVPVLESYSDILLHAGLGHLEIKPGSPPGGPPEFFECRLHPWKAASGSRD
jgi:hypothetical protein